MPYELVALAIAGLLWVVHFALVAVAAHRQFGKKYLYGPRDEQKQPTGTTGRLFRALNNYNEGLLVFAVAVGVTVMAGKTGDISAWCAGIFLGARVLYIPAYALGWSPWRSYIWTVGLLACVVMLLAALFT
ncbi:MAPEG family protein [Minwuia sp.]|uniref:MAPEG family protein n=1 Tax=Minwuia sp. TaxID=2493630 RepID=UPI003A91C034